VEESEVMQARPVYVAAVDLSCKIRYQFLSSGEFLKKSVTCNIAYYPLIFLSFIVFAAASEEFLELIKSALLAALEGMWIYTTLWTWRRIFDKSHVIVLLFHVTPFHFVHLFCSLGTRLIIWACYIRPQDWAL